MGKTSWRRSARTYREDGMEQEKAEKKEIVEIKDGRVEVAPDEERVLELTRTYSFEGEQIYVIDFSGLEDITADDMIRANNIMTNAGTVAVVPENNMHYALIIASSATGIPIEFFKRLRPRDAIKVKNMVTRFFYGTD